jgi:cytochrome o ubiquinol oxidase subunit II
MGIEMRRSLTLVFFLVAATLGGCSEGILDPKGPIAVAERQILFNSLGIMLAIVIPTILATLIVAFWFRSSNARARYLPDFTYSGRLEILVWSIPAMTVLLVGGVAWLGAHDLDPRRPISSTVKPVSVQVVSLDWKWPFIYPDKGIASVNRLVVPVGVPISFQLTSSGVMNSFFVPQLGGQIYTMSGMTTQLQLQADHSGSYPGLSAQFSGDGFADMRFIVDAVPDEQFEQWVSATRIRRRPKRWPGARPADIFRFGKAKRGSRAFHISQGGSQSVQRNHPGLRDAVRRSALFDRSSVTEGRKMNLLGKLTWSAIPFDQPIVMAATGGMVGAVVLILGWITLKGHWPYLWREWITSVDHKRIGVMYCVLALIMLLRGFADAIMMRSQQAMAAGGAQGYLPPEHFDQVFSAHGTIMIFFMAMPFVIGMMNFVVPLQLGVRDMAFPTLNSVALGLTASGILLTNVSLAVGEFAKTGWVAYPPLSELQYSPGIGVDYYLWALQISGIGTLLTGINFVTTILKTRAPGMGYMRMPVFCWTALASNLLMVAAFPVLTATFAMLLLDRYLGFHFFSTDAQAIR